MCVGMHTCDRVHVCSKTVSLMLPFIIGRIIQNPLLANDLKRKLISVIVSPLFWLNLEVVFTSII